MHSMLLAVCCLVSGHVHTSSGSPIAGAAITIRTHTTTRATTDATGTFAIQAAPGDYQVSITAQGYVAATVDVDVKNNTNVDVTLQPLDAPTLRTIAAVAVDGRLAPIQGTIPSITITRAQTQQAGQQRVVDALQTLPSITFARPDGGLQSSIAVAALRGPDPSESLVTLDGQTLNDGNTGDVDLSQLPIAAFSAVNVTEGLGPEDSNGSNTFGGAINLISLQPTQKSHVSFQETGGSWGESEVWLNATGTQKKLGYAVAVDDHNMRGYVSQYVPLYSSTDPGCQPCTTALGSSLASHAALANFTWNFSQRANLSARVFALGNIRDQSASINGIDGNAASPTYGQFIGPGNQTLAQN
ncbi:MAG TPA: TonB-dependent receptor, partial [Candidatus Aquilonibacter sp.]|nr:TonB-dependent receptor [Candidatus Aquilonibacter sp.]